MENGRIASLQPPPAWPNIFKVPHPGKLGPLGSGSRHDQEAPERPLSARPCEAHPIMMFAKHLHVGKSDNDLEVRIDSPQRTGNVENSQSRWILKQHRARVAWRRMCLHPQTPESVVVPFAHSFSTVRDETS